MVNHDLNDTLEDRKAIAAERALHETIRSLREYLMETNSSLFSAGELGKLILPDRVEYNQQYLEWLLALKRRINTGILGGRHSVVTGAS